MNIENLAKFVKHSFGSQVAIGIEGDNALEIFNAFWNWGATNGEPVEESKRFVWFWTQPERLEHALVMIMLNRLLNDNKGIKGKKFGMIKEATEMAHHFLEEVQEEHFLPSSEIVYKYTFGLQDGRWIDVNKTDCQERSYGI